jgi:hypothetical protein
MIIGKQIGTYKVRELINTLGSLSISSISYRVCNIAGTSVGRNIANITRDCLIIKIKK